MDRPFRAAAIVAALAVMVAACGTRLSEEDRELVITGLTARGGGGVVTSATGAGTTGTGAGSTGTTTETTGTTGGDAGATDDAGSAATSGGATGGDAGSGTAGGGTTDGGVGTTGSNGPIDTRPAPPGGNGGATDVGVTETEIVIYNVVDVNGTVQGLFEDAKDATQAYWAYFTSTEGTIYGRQIKYVFKDAQLSTQANRSAYLEACDKAFAAVGSMSAFEQGAAGPIKDCGIADVRTAAVSPEIQSLPTMVSAINLQPGQVALSEWTYYREQIGDGVKKSGYLWIDNATTSFQTDQNRRATSQNLGYEWIEEIPIGLSETNYASIIQQLKASDVQFVAFQGDASQAVRLGEAMKQQGWKPQIFALQSNTYGQKLLDGVASLPQDYVEIFRVAQPGALVEEIDSNPEMQLYAEWLNRVKPGARPTGLGMYSWAAMKMFVGAVKAAGPNLTREALLDELNQISGYTANGLIPPQNYAEEVATDCVNMLRIEGGRFVRAEPGNDYRCREQPAFL